MQGGIITGAKILLWSRRSFGQLSVLLVLLLFFLCIPVVSADDEAVSNYLPADYIQSIIDNTPATNPHFLDEARFDPATVAVAGEIPAFSKGENAYRWSLVLQGVMEKINDESLLASYQWDHGGFIIGYGCMHDYVQILVYTESEYTDEDIAQVIKIVQDAGAEEGITSIPIIVIEDTHAQKFLPEPEPDKAKTIPGLGLGINSFFVILVALSVRKLKK